MKTNKQKEVEEGKKLVEMFKTIICYITLIIGSLVFAYLVARVAARGWWRTTNEMRKDKDGKKK